jgi:REP element-mobilizing transposase RayT
MPDHVHILVDIPATTSVSNFIKAIKRESSYLLKTNSSFPKWNGWQEGYGAFTYSVKDIPAVKQYIINQKEHHQSLSFIDEYRKWLIEMGVSPDEPYFPK